MTTDNTAIARGLAELVHASGTNSHDHGFHDDWPLDETSIDSDETKAERSRQIGLAITEKLALIHEEISEALGEIRSGRDPLESYFVDTKGIVGTKGESYARQVCNDEGIPLLKPEGFLVELADAAIRIGDLVYLVKGSDQFVEAREIKHEYNATRPYKHGRKF